MYRMGWLLIGFGVLLLLTHGGFGFFFPLLFLLLFFGFFGGWRRRYGYGWAGPRGGWHGYGRGGCYGPPDERGERSEPRPAENTEERGYTGETTQL